MTTYALIIWLTFNSFQVVETGLNYQDCAHLEIIGEMETGEDLECKAISTKI